MKNITPCFLLVFFLIFLSEEKIFSQQCTANPPANLTATDIIPCAAMLHWSSVAGATKYNMRYKKTGTSVWIPAGSTHDTSFMFTGLLKTSQYDLQVRSVCADGSKSSYVKKKVTTPGCEIPFNISVAFDTNPVTISFYATCNFDTAHCQFGTTLNVLNSSVVATASPFTLTGLLPDKTYFFRINVCSVNKNSWTAIDSFHTAPLPPNVVLILLDDSRSDFYSCNGAPSFFQTPHIDRIANEGANFKKSFVVHSLCAPSRATIATGTYANDHHVIDNITQGSLNAALPLLPGILKSYGYYTALIGKSHKIFTLENGDFDYWMEIAGAQSESVFTFKYFETLTTVGGYDTDILTDSAVAVMSRNTNPFFIWLSYQSTHTPLIPAPQYKGLYDTFPMPLGIDTAKYSVNYPSCLYNLGAARMANAAKADSLFFGTYEEMASVDEGVGKILHALDSLGKLDNTMIIFTSDNGHLLGEHALNLKRLAYEQSMRVPLFIRYPAWFASSTLVSNQFALNIDIAPTILDAAGITNTFNMDGVSVKQLSDGSFNRNEIYYHYWWSPEPGWAKLPAIKAVRDAQYKFVSYNCDQITSEFFDLESDPLEMNNLINNSSYSSKIMEYQNKLINLENQFGDTMPEAVSTCQLANPYYLRHTSNTENQPLILFPNPADQYFLFSFNDNSTYQLHLYNYLGEEIIYEKMDVPLPEIFTGSLPQGIYLVSVESNGLYFHSKLVVAH